MLPFTQHGVRKLLLFSEHVATVNSGRNMLLFTQRSVRSLLLFKSNIWLFSVSNMLLFVHAAVYAPIAAF